MKKIKPLKLPMGSPNNCFGNAATAVLKHPSHRLDYVEGFFIDPSCPCGLAHNHAWVVDIKTGNQHELTYTADQLDAHPGSYYIGRRLSPEEIYEQVEGFGRRPILSLKEQFEMLTREGFTVKLIKTRKFLKDGMPYNEYRPITAAEVLSLNGRQKYIDDEWKPEWAFPEGIEIAKNWKGAYLHEASAVGELATGAHTTTV